MFVACVRNISKLAQNKQISHLACSRANLLRLCSKVLAVYRPLVGSMNPTHLWISVFELMDSHVLRQGSKMRLGLSEFESAVGKHERYHAKKPKAWLGQMGNPLSRVFCKACITLYCCAEWCSRFNPTCLLRAQFVANNGCARAQCL